MTTLRLAVDTEVFSAGLRSLSELAERFPQIADGVVESIEAGQAFDLHVAPASGAGVTLVGAKPSHALLLLCSTLGASDSDLAVLEHAFGHGATLPIVDLDNRDGGAPRRDSQEHGGDVQSSTRSAAQEPSS